MQLRLLAIALITTAAAAATRSTDDDDDDTATSTRIDIDSAFDNFKAHFSKSYANEDDEHSSRLAFEANMLVVAKHNAAAAATHKNALGVTTVFEMEMNQFADMTREQFKASRVCSGTPTIRTGKPLGTKVYSGVALPESVDWVAKGAVTGVKEQGNCGSCWSFSATGALEGAWFIAGHGLISLAEQEFVDCDDVDLGCEGGFMRNGFQFSMINNVCTEKSYPYVASGGKCKKASCKVGIPRGSVVGFHAVDHTEEAMMEAVAQQPISIAVEADETSFQLYSKGIITTGCGDQLDHAVLLVGYGTLNGSKYWKVKNSWGPSWGMNGYVLIARGGVEGQGECGIRGDPSFPVVKMAEIVA